MNLALFDLDHTLLLGDSDFLWGQFLCQRGIVDAEGYGRENARFYAEYQAGVLDIAAFCAFSLKPLTEHPIETLHAWRAEFVEEKIVPVIAPAAPALLERHRAQGDTLLITTATNRFITEPIAALLGVSHLLATDPEMKDGRYTGAVAGTPNFQSGKVTRLKAWMAERLPFSHLTAYSDSRNDLPLLELAHRAVAVDPDVVLKAEAQRRGWRVISLKALPLMAEVE